MPVTVHASGQPIAPGRWPDRRVVGAGRSNGAWTTWRELLLASAAVGRSVGVLCALYPGFAVPELRARLETLRSALGADADGSGHPVAVPSEWLIYGADPTERAAAAYRIGMAAAHWTAVLMLGLGETVHLSSLPSSDPRRRGALQPDLISTAPAHAPREWLVEAKGGLCIPSPTRWYGSDQLDSPRQDGWTRPHAQALVSAAMDPLLHIVVDVGLPPGATPAPGVNAPWHWPLPTEGPPTGTDLFWGRAVITAALIDSDAAAVRLGDTGVDVRLLDVPGADVCVGLVESAYAIARPQVLRARATGTRSGEEQADDVASEAVRAERPSHVDAVQLVEALSPLMRRGESVALLAAGPGPGAAVDAAGRVLVAGPSWSSAGVIE